MSFQKTKRLISLFVSVCFLATEILWANPALPAREVPEVKYAPALEIPERLGTIEEIRYPETKNAPFLIHIQTVHGHYETAVQIKEIIHYFKEHYGVDLLFAEGASEALHPEFLKFLSDPEQNLKVIDALAQKGELTGVDLALLDPSIQALGIENPDLYREAYEAFKSVISRLDQSQAWLEKERLEIDKKGSKIFSRELRELLSEWLKFHSGRRDLMAAIRFLHEQARDHLDLDFENPFSQFDWPQLTRLVLLQELEKRQDDAKLEEERGYLETWLQEQKISIEFIQFLNNKKVIARRTEGPTKQSLPDRQAGLRLLRFARNDSPRNIAEKFLERAFPKGFHFRDYPQIAYQTAHKILESELDAKHLFEEFDKLFEQLFAKKATTEEERELIKQYKDLILLQKLLTLELTPADQRSLRRFAPRDDALEDIFRTAIHFYELMEKRESAFLEKITSSLRAERSEMKQSQGLLRRAPPRNDMNIAILVTGGFHTDGLKQLFRGKDIGYAIVTPRISGDLDNSLYHKIMTRTANIERAGVLQTARAEFRLVGDFNFIRSEVRSFRQTIDDVAPKAEIDSAWLNDREKFIDEGTAVIARSEARVDGPSTEQRPREPERSEARNYEFLEVDTQIAAQVERLMQDSEIQAMLQSSLRKNEKVYFTDWDAPIQMDRLNRDTASILGAAYHGPIGKGYHINLGSKWGTRSRDSKLASLQHEIGHIAFGRHLGEKDPNVRRRLNSLYQAIKAHANEITMQFYQHFYDYEVVKFQYEKGWQRSAVGYMFHILDVSEQPKEYREDYFQHLASYALFYIAAPLLFEQKEPENQKLIRQRFTVAFEVESRDLPWVHGLIEEIIAPVLMDHKWTRRKHFNRAVKSFTGRFSSIFEAHHRSEARSNQGILERQMAWGAAQKLGIAGLKLPSEIIRVLVVEDDDQIQGKIVSAILKGVDQDEKTLQLETASDGEQGLKKLRGGTFDLLITDINMPKLQGDKMVLQGPKRPTLIHSTFKSMKTTENLSNVVHIQKEGGYDGYLVIESVIRLMRQKPTIDAGSETVVRSEARGQEANEGVDVFVSGGDQRDTERLRLSISLPFPVGLSQTFYSPFLGIAWGQIQIPTIKKLTNRIYATTRRVKLNDLKNSLVKRAASVKLYEAMNVTAMRRRLEWVRKFIMDLLRKGIRKVNRILIISQELFINYKNKPSEPITPYGLTARSEARGISRQDLDLFFGDVNEVLVGFTGDFGLHRFDYEFKPAEEVENEFPEVIRTYRSRGFMLNTETAEEDERPGKKIHRNVLWIDPDLKTLTFESLIEFIERSVQVKENVYDQRDLEAARQLLQKKISGEDPQEDIPSVAGLRDFTAWRQLIQKYVTRSEARAVRPSEGPAYESPPVEGFRRSEAREIAFNSKKEQLNQAIDRIVPLFFANGIEEIKEREALITELKESIEVMGPWKWLLNWYRYQYVQHKKLLMIQGLFLLMFGFFTNWIIAAGIAFLYFVSVSLEAVLRFYPGKNGISSKRDLGRIDWIVGPSIEPHFAVSFILSQLSLFNNNQVYTAALIWLSNLLKEDRIEELEKHVKEHPDDFDERVMAFQFGLMAGRMDPVEPWQEEFPIERIMSAAEHLGGMIVDITPEFFPLAGGFRLDNIPVRILIQGGFLAGFIYAQTRRFSPDPKTALSYAHRYLRYVALGYSPAEIHERFGSPRSEARGRRKNRLHVLKERGFTEKQAGWVLNGVRKSVKRLTGYYKDEKWQVEDLRAFHESVDELVSWIYPAELTNQDLATYQTGRIEIKIPRKKRQANIRENIAHEIWHHFRKRDELADAFAEIQLREDGLISKDKDVKKLYADASIGLADYEKILIENAKRLYPPEEDDPKDAGPMWYYGFGEDLGQLLVLLTNEEFHKAYSILDLMDTGLSLESAFTQVTRSEMRGIDKPQFSDSIEKNTFSGTYHEAWNWILKNTDPDDRARHLSWFVDDSEEGTVQSLAGKYHRSRSDNDMRQGFAGLALATIVEKDGQKIATILTAEDHERTSLDTAEDTITVYHAVRRFRNEDEALELVQLISEHGFLQIPLRYTFYRNLDDIRKRYRENILLAFKVPKRYLTYYDGGKYWDEVLSLDVSLELRAHLPQKLRRFFEKTAKKSSPAAKISLQHLWADEGNLLLRMPAEWIDAEETLRINRARVTVLPRWIKKGIPSAVMRQLEKIIPRSEARGSQMDLSPELAVEVAPDVFLLHEAYFWFATFDEFLMKHVKNVKDVVSRLSPGIDPDTTQIMSLLLSNPKNMEDLYQQWARDDLGIFAFYIRPGQVQRFRKIRMQAILRNRVIIMLARDQGVDPAFSKWWDVHSETLMKQLPVLFRKGRIYINRLFAWKYHTQEPEQLVRTLGHEYFQRALETLVKRHRERLAQYYKDLLQDEDQLKKIHQYLPQHTRDIDNVNFWHEFIAQVFFPTLHVERELAGWVAEQKRFIEENFSFLSPVIENAQQNAETLLPRIQHLFNEDKLLKEMDSAYADLKIRSEVRSAPPPRSDPSPDKGTQRSLSSQNLDAPLDDLGYFSRKMRLMTWVPTRQVIVNTMKTIEALANTKDQPVVLDIGAGRMYLGHLLKRENRNLKYIAVQPHDPDGGTLIEDNVHMYGLTQIQGLPFEAYANQNRNIFLVVETAETLAGMIDDFKEKLLIPHKIEQVDVVINSWMPPRTDLVPAMVKAATQLEASLLYFRSGDYGVSGARVTYEAPRDYVAMEPLRVGLSLSGASFILSTEPELIKVTIDQIDRPELENMMELQIPVTQYNQAGETINSIWKSHTRVRPYKMESVLPLAAKYHPPRSEVRAISRQDLDLFFGDVNKALAGLTDDFALHHFDYEFKPAEEDEATRKKVHRNVLWIDPDLKTLTFENLMEFIERSVQVKEDVYELRDLDAARQLLQEKISEESRKENVPPVAGLRDFTAWRQLIQQYVSRAEVRSEEIAYLDSIPISLKLAAQRISRRRSEVRSTEEKETGPFSWEKVRGIFERIHRTAGNDIFSTSTQKSIAGKIGTFQMRRGQKALVVGTSSQDYLPILLDGLGMDVSIFEMDPSKREDEEAIIEKHGFGSRILSFDSAEMIPAQKFDSIFLLAVLNTVVTDPEIRGGVEHLETSDVVRKVWQRLELEENIEEKLSKILIPIVAGLNPEGGRILMNDPSWFYRDGAKFGITSDLILRLLNDAGNTHGVKFERDPGPMLDDFTMSAGYLTEPRTGEAFAASRLSESRRSEARSDEEKKRPEGGISRRVFLGRSAASAAGAGLPLSKEAKKEASKLSDPEMQTIESLDAFFQDAFNKKYSVEFGEPEPHNPEPARRLVDLMESYEPIKAKLGEGNSWVQRIENAKGRFVQVVGELNRYLADSEFRSRISLAEESFQYAQPSDQAMELAPAYDLALRQPDQLDLFYKLDKFLSDTTPSNHPREHAADLSRLFRDVQAQKMDFKTAARFVTKTFLEPIIREESEQAKKRLAFHGIPLDSESLARRQLIQVRQHILHGFDAENYPLPEDPAVFFNSLVGQKEGELAEALTEKMRRELESQYGAAYFAPPHHRPLTQSIPEHMQERRRRNEVVSKRVFLRNKVAEMIGKRRESGAEISRDDEGNEDRKIMGMKDEDLDALDMQGHLDRIQSRYPAPEAAETESRSAGTADPSVGSLWDLAAFLSNQAKEKEVQVQLAIEPNGRLRSVAWSSQTDSGKSQWLTGNDLEALNQQWKFPVMNRAYPVQYQFNLPRGISPRAILRVLQSEDWIHQEPEPRNPSLVILRINWRIELGPPSQARRGVNPDMPVWFLLDQLSLLNVRPAEDSNNGELRTRSITIPKADSIDQLYVNLGFLREELAPLDKFDLLFNENNDLIAIFPFVEERYQAGLDPGMWFYFDFSNYYFEIPEIGIADEQAAFAWNELSEEAVHNRNLIEQYKREKRILNKMTAYPSQGQKAYVYAEIDQGTGAIKLSQFSPTDFKPESFNHLKKDKHQLIFAVLPSVYSPATADHSRPDRGYHGKLYVPDKDLNSENDWLRLQSDHDVLVLGTGSGFDTWLTYLSMLRNAKSDAQKVAKIFASDDNPIAVANARALARQAGYDLEAKVYNNVISEDGVLVFGNKRFHRVIWGMPRISATFDMKPFEQGMLKAMRRWDGESGQVLQQLSKGLPQILLPQGLGFFWNARFERIHPVDYVKEMLASAGTFDIELKRAETPNVMEVKVHIERQQKISDIPYEFSSVSGDYNIPTVWGSNVDNWVPALYIARTRSEARLEKGRINGDGESESSQRRQRGTLTEPREWESRSDALIQSSLSGLLRNQPAERVARQMIQPAIKDDKQNPSWRRPAGIRTQNTLISSSESSIIDSRSEVRVSQQDPLVSAFRLMEIADDRGLEILPAHRTALGFALGIVDRNFSNADYRLNLRRIIEAHYRSQGLSFSKPQSIPYFSILENHRHAANEPVRVIRIYESLPGLHDPEIQVLIDFLAANRQAYLFIEIQNEAAEVLTLFEQELRASVQKRRKGYGISGRAAHGVNLRVVSGSDAYLDHLKDLNYTRALVYGNHRSELRKLQSSIPESARQQTYFAEDDLGSEADSLKQSSALLVLLDDLLSSKPLQTIIVSVVDRLTQNLGMIKQVQALLSQSA